jgi:cytoskeletal protein RodZ
MLANRRFAIPLIILLAFCFIGLILIGVVLIWQPGAPDDGGAVAQDTASPTVEPTETVPPTSTATATSTPRPSPTLVVLDSPGTGTAGGETPEAGTEEPVSTVEVGETQVAAEETLTAAAGESVSSADQTATAEAASGEEATTEPTETETVEDEELAQTGIGWGLILFSGVGLGLLAIAARRLRMAS